MSKVRSLLWVLFLVLFLLSSIPATRSLAAPTNTCISEITRVSLPAPSAGTVSIDGIAAASPNDVWAVGFNAADLFSPRSSLIEHWNGTAWSIVPSAEVDSESSWLQDVAVISPSDVWAVGSSQQSDTTAGTLIQHWNGTAWSLVPSPNGPLANNVLVSVAGAAANDVWAVGSAYQDSSLPTASLILHWNGTDWQIVSSPTNGAFIRVVAKATDDVWALAHASDWGPNFYSRAQILHWDGAAWSLVTEFDLGTGANGSESVTDMLAWADDDIWVTGGYWLIHSHQGRTWHWDGTSWSNVAGNPAPVNSIAGTRPDNAWSVGYATPDIGPQSLFARWDGTTWNSSNLYNAFGDFIPTKLAAVSDTEFWIASWASTNPSLLHGILTCTTPPTEQAELVTPAQDEIVTSLTPTFDWGDTADTNFYNLELTMAGPPDSWSMTYRNINASELTLEYIPNQLADYSWRVQACNYVGCGAWGELRTFQLIPPIVAPELVAPPTGSQVKAREVTLEWSAVENAEWYEYGVYTDVPSSKLIANGSVTTTNVVVQDLEQGPYFWLVKACSTSDGCSSHSKTFRFTLTYPPPARPTLLIPGPKDEVNMRKPYFEWSSSGDDAFYLLQLRTKNKNGLIVDTLEVGTTEHIRWNKILPTGHYYWRVKACDVFAGCGKWSKGRKFYLDKN